MGRHKRAWDKAPTVREIYKLDYIALIDKLSKQVSWKKKNSFEAWQLLDYFRFFLFLFFYQGFLSRTLTTHRTAGEGRGHLFSTLHVIWLSHIFNLIACNYQTATWWDLPPYRITILIDWLMITWSFDSRFFVIAIWFGKTVDSKSHRLLPLYYK